MGLNEGTLNPLVSCKPAEEEINPCRVNEGHVNIVTDGHSLTHSLTD